MTRWEPIKRDPMLLNPQTWAEWIWMTFRRVTTWKPTVSTFLFWTFFYFGFNLNLIWQFLSLFWPSVLSFSSYRINSNMDAQDWWKLLGSAPVGTQHTLMSVNCYIWCILIISTSLFLWATSPVMNNSRVKCLFTAVYKRTVDLTLR